MDGGSVKPSTFRKIFEEACPYYLALGMTYDQFWNEDPRMVIAFRKADEIRRIRENQTLWLQGRYIYDALCEASPLFRLNMKGGRVKANDYTEEPYPITESEVRAKEERERQRQMERMKMQFMEYASHLKIKKSGREHQESQSSEEGMNNGNFDD